MRRRFIQNSKGQNFRGDAVGLKLGSRCAERPAFVLADPLKIPEIFRSGA